MIEDFAAEGTTRCTKCGFTGLYRATCRMACGWPEGAADTYECPCCGRWFVEAPGSEPEVVEDEKESSVCVLCGAYWPPFQNRCECGGFCTWGPAKGADPSSWIVTGDGWVPRPPTGVGEE